MLSRRFRSGLPLDECWQDCCVSLPMGEMGLRSSSRLEAAHRSLMLHAIWCNAGRPRRFPEGVGNESLGLPPVESRSFGVGFKAADELVFPRLARQPREGHVVR